MLVGMTAALVQGVPGSTLDTDLWIDLPERQYMRVINHAVRLGAQALSPNVNKGTRSPAGKSISLRSRRLSTTTALSCATQASAAGSILSSCACG